MNLKRWLTPIVVIGVLVMGLYQCSGKTGTIESKPVPRSLVGVDLKNFPANNGHYQTGHEKPLKLITPDDTASKALKPRAANESRILLKDKKTGQLYIVTITEDKV